MEGYNSTIFAYGHTGAGKTFTMEGSKYNSQKGGSENQYDGVIGNSVRFLYNKISQNTDPKLKYKVYMSYLQIYNEQIFDLLNPSQFSNDSPFRNGLRIRQKNKEFVVENLSIFECPTVKDAFNLINYGSSTRIVSMSKFNHVSSRSHSMLTIHLEIIDMSNPDDSIISKFNLIDLAGSEKGSTSPVSPTQQKESIDINKSLFYLRQVITTLNQVQKGKPLYIPYRDSKLTSLLSGSLGGNSYCLMIANIAPSLEFLEDNISTLNYSSKASIIKNNPEKNVDPKIAYINELKVTINRKKIQN